MVNTNIVTRILFEETIIGAIGVSGATSAQDDEIAGAAIATYLT